MSLADQLEKLQNLLGAGLISQEEFEVEKTRLFTERSTSTTGGMGGASSGQARFSGEQGAQLGAYRLLGLIGEGGMGSVYRARHTQSAVAERQGGEVVIKVMHAQYANREDFRARFEREADVGLRLDHPNLVKVHDLVMDGGQLALVMEYVEGRPLSEMIGQETGPIPWERAGPMFAQLLDGVEHAHGAGVVHRDLKPENIMVTGDGTIKVLDFGIAKSDDGGKTKTGTGLGTVDYMAPEQYLDAKRVDHRADIYALGMTLYEMLAGRLPWDVSTTTEFEVLDWKRHGDLPPPTDFYPSVPPHIVDVVMAALTVDLDERVPSIEALRDRLTATPVPAPEAVPVGVDDPKLPEETLRIQTVRIASDEVPVLDGSLDDPVWEKALPEQNFKQVFPGDGVEPSEKTEVRILYDDRNLYFGIRCFDSEPDKINARQMMRDFSHSGDDSGPQP